MQRNKFQRVGEPCTLTAMLPNEQHITVTQAVVRWARENEFGVETSTVDRHAQDRLRHYVQRLVNEPLARVP